ncbi:MAG: hypothetical protein B7Z26_00715 [Asticcacaulis sp. 32-58-5]|nr:MAG: hypothetical protein B7Z26_00715 [Asticcacaulis sp. 32-58-5]
MADMATGGLIARAVDGDQGGPSGHDGVCANCGTKLTGPYCHACGQAGHVHRTLHGFVHDILHGVFHFEGRVWHTLPMLLFRPGQLTRRYIDGERVKFISPMAIFLFLVFTMFAVFSWVDSDATKVNYNVNSRQVSEGITAREQAITALEAQRADIAATGASTAAIEAEIREEQEAVKYMRSGLVLAQGGNQGGKVPEVKTGIGFIDKLIYKIAKNPSLFFYKLQSSAYKFLWLLIPISLPFIWLMFAGHKGVALYDHAVFATYSLSAMMVLLIVTHLLGAIRVHDLVLAPLVMLFPPIHMYKHIRGAYGVGRFGAAWRVVFLLVAAGISTLLFLAVLIEMMMGHA